MKVFDEIESMGAGLFVGELGAPPNSWGSGTYNFRISPTGAPITRAGVGVHNNNPIGQYSVAATATYTGGVVTCGTASFITGGAVSTSAGGGGKWLFVGNGTAYTITGVTATTVTVSGLGGSGSFTSGNWYVCYIGEVVGVHCWYKEADPTTKYKLVCFGNRLDRIAEDGSILILKTDLTDITGTGKMLFTQVGDDVVCSNNTDAPVFVNPGTGTVSGQNSALSAPSDPLYLFSYYDSSIPTSQSLQTGQGFQNWRLARQTKGGGSSYGVRSGAVRVKVATAPNSTGFDTALNGGTSVGGTPDRFIDYDEPASTTERGAVAYQYTNPIFMVPGNVDSGFSTGTASLNSASTTVTISTAITCAVGDVFWCDNKWYRITTGVSAGTSIVIDRVPDSTTASGYTYWIFPNKFAGGGSPKLTIHGTGFVNGGEAELDSVTWGATAPQVNDGDVLIAFYESSYTPTGTATTAYMSVTETEASYGGTRYLHKITLTGANFLSTFKMEPTFRGKNISCWQVSPNSGTNYYNVAYWDGVTTTNPGITETVIYYWVTASDAAGLHGAGHTTAFGGGTIASGNLRIRPQGYARNDADYTGFPQSGGYAYVGTRYGAGNVGYRMAVVQGLKNDGSSRKLTLRCSTGPIYQTTKFALIRGLGASSSYAHLLFKSGKQGASSWENDTYYTTPTLLGVGYGTLQPTLGCAVVDQYANTWNEADKEILTQSSFDIPRHKVSCIAKQRVVVGNLRDWDASTTRHPKRIDYTRLNNIAQLEGDSREVGIAGPQGEVQMMFYAYGSLWVILDRGMYQLSGNQMDALSSDLAFPDVGCVSWNTAAAVGQEWMWLDSKAVVWRFSGGRPTQVQLPIYNDLVLYTPTQMAQFFAFSANGLYYLSPNTGTTTYIYDPLADPSASGQGGWTQDDFGITAASARRGGGETTDFVFAARRTFSTTALQYLYKGEVPQQYCVDYWKPSTASYHSLVMRSRLLTTDQKYATKKWKKFAAYINTPGVAATVAVRQTLGDGTWTNVPISV